MLTPEMKSKLVRQLIEGLHENESVTSTLTDDSAKILLQWGEERIKELVEQENDPAKVENLSYRLQQLMRSISRFIELKSEVSETELTQRLIALAEKAMLYVKEQ